MKIISSFISIIHVLAFTKFNIVEGGGAGFNRLVGQAVGQAAVEAGLGAALNSGNKRRRSRGRLLLAADDSFESAPEFEQCQEETYDTKLYFDYGHLIFLASPKSKESNNCPIVAIDNGYMDGDESVLVPHVSLEDEVPEGGLSLDHSITLGSLSNAISNLDLNDHMITMDEYSLLTNNCGAFLMAIWDKIGLNYKESKTSTIIVNYVGDYAAKEAMSTIRKTYLEQNEGMLHQITFNVWNYYVGDEEVARTLVRNYMNSME